MNKIPVRVLFVDDEETARAALGRMLGRTVAGYKTAADGQEALELFENEPFDVVITDIRMPRMSGLELSREIKRRNPAVSIFVVTAHSEASYRKEAADAGIAAYIVKPVDMDDLMTRLRRHADSTGLKSAGGNSQ